MNFKKKEKKNAKNSQNDNVNKQSTFTVVKNETRTQIDLQQQKQNKH